MQTSFKPYDVVRLRVARPEVGTSTKGTIVVVYDGEPQEYEVEFCDEDGVRQLRSLRGQTVESVDCIGPAWDLRIRFSDGKELVTFSDHLEPGASVETNWELWARGRYLSVGPGSVLTEG